MQFENLLVSTVDHVLWITVNRQTVRELGEAAAMAAATDEVWAVVVTGAGDKAFVAGADIVELNTLGPIDAKQFAVGGQEVFRRFETLTKPVVAAVNGFAFGGGCELAMACHLRVATRNAVFGQPEVKLGLIPGFGGTQRLPRLIGRGRALEILLTGRNVGAEEAHQIGLVNAVCEPAEVADAVSKLLSPILANGPLAVASCIEAVNRGQDLDLAGALEIEADLFAVGSASPQMAEGTAAFLEKRKADFRSAG